MYGANRLPLRSGRRMPRRRCARPIVIFMKMTQTSSPYHLCVRSQWHLVSKR